MGMKLSEQFQRFAKYECENSSKLYEVLSYQIAEDAELLDIVTTIPTGQPKPNLLFAIVHYLLFEKDESLKITILPFQIIYFLLKKLFYPLNNLY